MEKPEDVAYFVRLDEKCHKAGICKSASLGKGTMLIMDSEKYVEFISDTLKTEPRFLTVGGDKFEE